MKIGIHSHDNIGKCKNSSKVQSTCSQCQIKNRRTCIRLQSSAQGGDKTSTLINRTTYIYKYSTRVTKNLFIPALDDLMKTIKVIAQELLIEFAQIDDKIILLNWYENGTASLIAPNTAIQYQQNLP